MTSKDYKCLKKANKLNYERKIKSPFMIYADFESILAPEDNGIKNSGELYTNKYRKHIACSYCLHLFIYLFLYLVFL